MAQIENIVQLLNRTIEMMKTTLADFSDADMVVRPCPGANHAAWQIGHLVSVESHMLHALQPGAVPAASPAFAEKFNKQTASIDDPGFFPKKAELIDAFTSNRLALTAWAQTLTPADLDRPTPEKFQRFAPTVGLLLMMTAGHEMMHMGQLQVIRRKLGKPLLF